MSMYILVFQAYNPENERLLHPKSWRIGLNDVPFQLGDFILVPAVNNLTSAAACATGATGLCQNPKGRWYSAIRLL